MKIILTTLNSKYIHSNLAIRYLSKYVEDITEVEIVEYTINQNIDLISSEIYKMNPDLIGFSTYIWNIEETLKICEILKKVKPDLKILLGGPEVSYDAKNLMEKYSFIDYIIFGEGEETFREFISNYVNGIESYDKIRGLVYRDDRQVIENCARAMLKDLNKIPSPYINGKNEFKNKIIYYESSRGCPFNCQFCLSSTIKGVRFFDIDRVKEDISLLIDWEVDQVKFVDRTFNANKKYAMEIMNFIIDKNPKNINFHFEVTAHLIDEEMLDFLSTVKEGIFQFEIGVQSTNDKTIEEVGRTTDFPKLSNIVKQISSFKNIHQHLDLIVGLPYENYDSFRKSFNDVYELKPEKLQLGFLKLLKGSGLRARAEKHGYRFLDQPPYEVLENDYIDYKDIVKLKVVEDLVEKYFNEGYFENTLEFIIKNYYISAFDFYEDFGKYWEDREYHIYSHSRNKLYEILLDYTLHKEFLHKTVIINLLRYDFLKNNKARLPKKLDKGSHFIEQRHIHNILRDNRILNYHLVEYSNLPVKKIINKVNIEKFDINILELIRKGYQATIDEREVYVLFDYKDGQINRCDVFDITEVVEEMI